MSELKRISQTFLSDKLSCTVIIPIDLARKHGLEKPANIIFEDSEDGILIKKVQV
jgi:hypothetical protein